MNKNFRDLEQKVLNLEAQLQQVVEVMGDHSQWLGELRLKLENNEVQRVKRPRGRPRKSEAANGEDGQPTASYDL
jgi:hypothetical protein